jgi:hypothetical protein
MRTISLAITEIEYDALRQKALRELFSVDDHMVRVAARKAMIDELITASYITFDEVYAAIGQEHSPEATSNGESKKIPSKPTALVLPQRTFSSKPSNTWIIWTTIVRLQMSEGKWMSFHTSDLQASLHQDQGISMDVKAANSALQTLCNSAWLYKSKADDQNKTNLYRFTNGAQRWLMDPKNQELLLRERIIDHEVKQLYNETQH